MTFFEYVRDLSCHPNFDKILNADHTEYFLKNQKTLGIELINDRTLTDVDDELVIMQYFGNKYTEDMQYMRINGNIIPLKLFNIHAWGRNLTLKTLAVLCPNTQTLKFLLLCHYIADDEIEELMSYAIASLNYDAIHLFQIRGYDITTQNIQDALTYVMRDYNILRNNPTIPLHFDVIRYLTDIDTYEKSVIDVVNEVADVYNIDLPNTEAFAPFVLETKGEANDYDADWCCYNWGNYCFVRDVRNAGLSRYAELLLYNSDEEMMTMYKVRSK